MGTPILLFLSVSYCSDYFLISTSDSQEGSQIIRLECWKNSWRKNSFFWEMTIDWSGLVFRLSERFFIWLIHFGAFQLGSLRTCSYIFSALNFSGRERERERSAAKCKIQTDSMCEHFAGASAFSISTSLMAIGLSKILKSKLQEKTQTEASIVYRSPLIESQFLPLCSTFF